MQTGRERPCAQPRPSWVRSTTLTAGLLLSWAGASATAPDVTEPASSTQPTILLVVGAAGEEPFGRQFEEWAASWRQLAERAQARLIALTPQEPTESSDKDRLLQLLRREPQAGLHPLWIVLLGHGTFDGHTAKFNLRGPDLSASELAQAIQSLTRPLVVVNAASASGPFLPALAGSNRVVITATKSGYEQNFARFGQYFTAALGDAEADLDQDGQTSLLEACLLGSRGVTEFYEKEGRLATEHALLDDNADGLGTPSDWFRGVHAVKKAKEETLPDGLRAHQLHLIPSEQERHLPMAMKARRDALELRLAQLRELKPELEETVYYRQLEGLLLELARIYEEAE